jgi:tRNA nucleotidyltransferase (CCA-adding enzyme)
MRLVITHEQADFDALASLLAANLLDETALPVLPFRMNRNVRSFLNLFGSTLPFIEPRDIPSGAIDAITLVDTQSMATIKGVSASTSVHVVDHHTIRPGLPTSWTVTFDSLGACTTLLVENLRERSVELQSIQATLLLLGIYEDTGSLSYAATTARDARAVAYLLEQGASLRTATQFLNPPLSTEQRQLYDKLLTAAVTRTIQDQEIVITTALADDIGEEVSSIAHKLRDLLDPDALFMIVKTGEGIRLVARSTSDNVDVSLIAGHFGGGGHDRAAAALIPGSSIYPDEAAVLAALEGVQQEILVMLPSVIRPSHTVGEIMSRRPMVLKPDTTAQEAARLMQRYGYEGYPVVENGKVIGLLTRRAVDRAVSHKLKLTASSLMEAGEVTVTAQDSIHQLRKLMAETGWGQVPVVNQERSDVIGIVTRTDLLKILVMTEAKDRGRMVLSHRLDSTLPEAHLALLKLVAMQAHELHLPAYIVGGFVRDMLLKRPSLDFDIVVEGDAISLGRHLSRRYGGRIATHPRFGTAKWQIGEVRRQLAEVIEADPNELPESLDLISARTEFYEYPTALPTVERGSIKLDLHRRDFTINTMAIRLDGQHYGELYDFWGGWNDLQNGIVRVLHSLSFVDDPTRILRAVRFEQRFGFQIESRTLRLLNEASSLLKDVTGPRLKHELDLILEEPKAALMLDRTAELNLLPNIHPDLVWDRDIEKAFSKARQLKSGEGLPDSVGSITFSQAIGYITWLSYRSPEACQHIAARLRFPLPLEQAVIDASRLRQDLPALVTQFPSAVTKRLDSTVIMAIAALRAGQQPADVAHILDEYWKTWRHIQPKTNGNDLQSAGIPPGPAYRRILTALRNAWLDGKIKSTEEEKALLGRLIKEV